MEIKNVIVTGSAGYIGCIVTENLRKSGFNVIEIDTHFFDNTYLGNHDKKNKPLRMDVRNVSPSDLKGIDAIIHLAALSNDALGQIQNELTFDINYKATVQLAKMAKMAGVKRFIFSSSASVYGISNKKV